MCQQENILNVFNCCFLYIFFRLHFLHRCSPEWWNNSGVDQKSNNWQPSIRWYQFFTSKSYDKNHQFYIVIVFVLSLTISTQTSSKLLGRQKFLYEDKRLAKFNSPKCDRNKMSSGKWQIIISFHFLSIMIYLFMKILTFFSIDMIIDFCWN